MLAGAADASRRRFANMAATAQATATSVDGADTPAEPVKAVAEAQEPAEQQCAGCSLIKPRDNFSAAQWYAARVIVRRGCCPFLS